MREQEFLDAALPLFLNNEVEVIEWSFDTIRDEASKPAWMHPLLKEYSDAGRLIGHGVRFSIFDASWTQRQQFWLRKLKQEVKRYNYQHMTEHFGFMSNTDFHKGAPMPVPLNEASLKIGIDRLRRIHETGGLAVGVENLAFAFSKYDVLEQGNFLDKLVEPVNGFLILDLHNIYCQAHNFNCDMLEIIEAYSLKKVKELHISGGSWQQSIYSKKPKKIRRDTHDGPVPKEIFSILPEVLKRCKNLEYVIFERMGDTIKDLKEQKQFRKDFLKIKSIVAETDFDCSGKKRKEKQKALPALAKKPLSDKILLWEQRHILNAMRNSKNPTEVLSKLNPSRIKDWKTEQWEIQMVETALDLMRKWD